VKRIFQIALLTALLFPILTAAPKPRSIQLPNGFTLILSPMDGVEATCVLTYHINGVRDDPPDMRGASYLYQYLMFLGTENLDPFDRIMFVKKVGGSSSGRVNYDNSVFYQVVPEDKWHNALWLETERLNSLKITEQNINQQKQNVYRRIYRLTNSSVAFRARNWVRDRVFEGTKYQVPLYGDLAKIQGLSNQRIQQLYDSFRNLSNIVMVVSGKFNPIQVMDFVNEHFSQPMRRRMEQKKGYTLAKPRTQYVYKNWLIEDLPQNFVMVGIRAPAKLSYDHLSFDVIRHYLLDERISKLEKIMNRVNNLDVLISSEYSDHVEANFLLIKISSAKRLNLEKAKYILEKEFEALKEIPLANSTMKMVKSMMELDFLKDMTRLERRSQLLAENYHLFGRIDFEGEYIERIRKVTQYDIMENGKKYLDKKNLVVLNVYKK